MNLLLSKVFRFIEQNSLLDNCENVIVGVSGGADSVCLINMLKEYVNIKQLPVKLHAVHINHCIRREAGDDEQFSKLLCTNLGVDFKAFKVDVQTFAKENGLTVEEAGRMERYRIFNEEASKYNKCRIAVAHHMNDQAETVLMNVARGTSIKGLCGIRPIRDNVIRPLLAITRNEIEEYLNCINQTFVTDVTNMDNDYTRNAIRNIIIPAFISNVNEAAVENVNSLADSVFDAFSYIEQEADKAFDKCVSDDMQDFIIDIAVFKQLDVIIQKRVIYKALLECAGTAKDIYNIHVSSVLELVANNVGKSIDLCYGIKAIRNYNDITISRKCDNRLEARLVFKEYGKLCLDEDFQVARVPVGEEIYFDKQGLVYVDSIELKKLQAPLTDKEILNSDYAKIFDYDNIKNDLTIRNRQEGDYITVSVGGAQKKLKKEFIDRKIPQGYRNSVPLLCLGSEVLWACGIRRCEAFLVSENTKNILSVRLITSRKGPDDEET